MMQCPVCATEMDRHLRHGVTIDHCPACGGVWLDKGELDHLIAAVRPAVTLPDPAPKPPEPPRPEKARREAARPARPVTADEPPRKRQSYPREGEDEGRYRKPRRSERGTSGGAKRYRGRYSARDRLEDILEEIFDFD